MTDVPRSAFMLPRRCWRIMVRSCWLVVVGSFVVHASAVGAEPTKDKEIFKKTRIKLVKGKLYLNFDKTCFIGSGTPHFVCFSISAKIILEYNFPLSHFLAIFIRSEAIFPTQPNWVV